MYVYTHMDTCQQTSECTGIHKFPLKNMIFQDDTKIRFEKRVLNSIVQTFLFKNDIHNDAKFEIFVKYETL